jgi:hypothetical protein
MSMTYLYSMCDVCKHMYVIQLICMSIYLCNVVRSNEHWSEPCICSDKQDIDRLYDKYDSFNFQLCSDTGAYL